MIGAIPTVEGGRRRASPRAATMSLHEPSERTESSATDPPQAGAGHAEQSQPVDRVIFGVSAALVVAFVVWGIASTDTLSEREAGVVRLRFGLTDGQPRTLDEIGQVYGVTRERIRQIESKTMSKLRHPSRSQVLRDYLD